MSTVKESIPIKYNISKVTLRTKITLPIEYDVYYAKVNELLPNISDYGDIVWEHYGKVQINSLGNITPEINLVELEDFSYYIVCFRNSSDISKVSFIRFKTGQNIALKESPYLDYTLFDGQNYTWFLDNPYQYIFPDKDTEANFYYSFKGNRREILHEAEEGGAWYGSFMPMIINADTLQLNVSYGDRYEKLIYSSNGIDESYMMCNLTPHLSSGSEPGFDFMACPCCKYDSDTEEMIMHEYWAYGDYGGGICYYDLKYCNVLFLLYVTSFKTGETPHDRILCFADNRIIPSDLRFNSTNSYQYIIIDSSGYLYTITNGVSSAISEYPLPLDTPLLVDCFNGNFKYKIPGQNDWTELLGYGLSISTPSPDETTRFNNKFPDFVGFGGCWDPLDVGAQISPSNRYSSANIYISDFVWIKDSCSDVDNVYNKILRPSIYNFHLRMTFTNDSNNNHTETTPTENTLVVKSDRITILIPEILFAKNNKITKVLLELISNNNVYATKQLKGLQLNKNSSNDDYNIEAFSSISKRIVGAFDYDFPNMTSEIRLQKLRESFFTKHGTWGGYNGGVNGFNTYISPEGYVRLENHGDKYKGSLKGVGKENLRIGTEGGYTGYGDDVNVDWAWDTRTNKQCLRVGTALVSNKYFGYGKLDVWMRIPKGTWGVCPAIWFFHYIEVGEDDIRYNTEPYMSRNRQGSSGDGYYRVINNEIDIELPSHLTNGHCTENELSTGTYFDEDTIDNQLTIGLDTGDNQNKGLYKIKSTGVNNPKDINNYDKIANEWVGRCYGSFQNCKFNTWIGELNSGDGWIVGTKTDYDGRHEEGISEDPQDTHKEEYLSRLTHLTDNVDGYADGKFHKWTIEWLPDRAVLYVDDVVCRVNKKFIPFNVMKLTIGTWFPSMKEVGSGVKDGDGIYGQKGAILSLSDSVSPGTWAGNHADWEVCNIDISRIKWAPYSLGDNINTFDNDEHGSIVSDNVTINKEPTYLGESFPESGLRYFESLADTSSDEIVGNTLFTNNSNNALVVNMQNDIAQSYFKSISNEEKILDLAALDNVSPSDIQDDTTLTDMMALAFSNKTSINATEFSGLTNVECVAFPPTLESIGVHAFSSIGMVEVEWHVYKGCDLYFTGPCPEINEDAFRWAAINNIYVPLEYASDYETVFAALTSATRKGTVVPSNITELNISINKNNIYKKVSGSNIWTIDESVNFNEAWNYIHNQ